MVSKVTSYTDFVLIVSATSDRHARAVADHLCDEMRERRVRPLGMEGYDSGQWILVDFGEVIVHVMLTGAREYYDLDHLWSDAESVAVATEETP